MTRDEFLKLIETYGADQSRWPEASLSEAQAFITKNPEYASGLLAEANRLDGALEIARIAPGTDMLKARILSAARSSGVAAANPAPLKPQGLRYRAVAAMVTGAFVLGFTGANYLNGGDVTNDPGLTADNEWEEIADDYGMSDVYAWARQDTLP